MLINILKILIPTTAAFFIGLVITPFLTHYLYKYKMWKKKSGKISPDGREAVIFNKLHKEKEIGTPRFGGVIIWASVLLTIFLLWLLATIFPNDITTKLNFLSRNQTWLPLFTLICASLLGLLDDFMQVFGKGDYVKGLDFSKRLTVVVLIGLIGGLWFYDKLEMYYLDIPFYGEIFIGWLIVPLFITVMLALFSSGVIDGLDGLAGGIMSIIFSAYAVIAFSQNQIDLAAFSAVIAGATLAFLWFNIPPARFYMSETGILGLTTTLTVIAFLTGNILFLPIIAFPLFATSASVIIQLTSKKIRKGRKVFLVAPLHHHFEAIGWPAYKVVMRYWVVGMIFASIGIILFMLDNVLDKIS